MQLKERVFGNTNSVEIRIIFSDKQTQIIPPNLPQRENHAQLQIAGGELEGDDEEGPELLGGSGIG